MARDAFSITDDDSTKSHQHHVSGSLDPMLERLDGVLPKGLTAREICDEVGVTQARTPMRSPPTSVEKQDDSSHACLIAFLSCMSHESLDGGNLTLSVCDA